MGFRLTNKAPSQARDVEEPKAPKPKLFFVVEGAETEGLYIREFKNAFVDKILGEIVMKELSQIDDVAYVRFASVYRDFQDIEAFKHMVSNLTTDANKQEINQRIEDLTHPHKLKHLQS